MDVYQRVLDGLNKATDADMERAVNALRYYGRAFLFVRNDGSVDVIRPEDVHLHRPLSDDAEAPE